MERFDPIGLIEKSYDFHQDPRAWLTALAAEVVPHLHPTWGVGMAYFYDPQASAAAPEGRAMPVGLVPVVRQSAGVEGEILTRYMKSSFGSFASPEQIRRAVQAMRTPGIESLVDVIGEMPALSLKEAPVPLVDSAALVVNAGLRVAIFCNLDTAKVHFDPPTRRLWQRIAIHLGAGCRLSERERRWGRRRTPTVARSTCSRAPAPPGLSRLAWSRRTSTKRSVHP